MRPTAPALVACLCLAGGLARPAAERAHPDPGAPRLRRLNRAEYGNAVRDRLALDPAALVPPDNAAFGFDNVADVRFSPTPLEPEAHTYTIRQDISQDQHIDGLPLGTRSAAPVDASVTRSGFMQRRVQR